MPAVDAELLKLFEQAQGKPVPVLITCQSECESVVTALKRKRIRITNTKSMILGVIGAEVTADQLEDIKSVPGISAIEHDQTATVFQ